MGGHSLLVSAYSDEDRDDLEEDPVEVEKSSDGESDFEISEYSSERGESEGEMVGFELGFSVDG